jgi:hypothetical protein
VPSKVGSIAPSQVRSIASIAASKSIVSRLDKIEEVPYEGTPAPNVTKFDDI